jgi:hypothetical protein
MLLDLLDDGFSILLKIALQKRKGYWKYVSSRDTRGEPEVIISDILPFVMKLPDGHPVQLAFIALARKVP